MPRFDPLKGVFGLLPTPIAGIIGADVLAAYVLDIRYAPCRVALLKAGSARLLRDGNGGEDESK